MHFSRPLFISLLASIAVARALPGEAIAPVGGEVSSSESSGPKNGDRGGGEASGPGTESGSTTGSHNDDSVDGGSPDLQQFNKNGENDWTNPFAVQNCKRSGCEQSASNKAEPEAPVGFGDESSSSESSSELEPSSGRDPDRKAAQPLADRHLEDGIPDTEYQNLEAAGYKLVSHESKFDVTSLVPVWRMQDKAPEGIFKTMKLDSSKYQAKGAQDTKDIEADDIVSMDIDPENGHVIVQSKNRDEDRITKLPFSEISGQVIRRVFDKGINGYLKAVTQHTIENDVTKGQFEKYFPNLPSLEVRTITPEDNPDAWNALGDSPNGWGLFRYAYDHFSTNQGWQPVRAHIIKTQIYWDMTWEYGEGSKGPQSESDSGTQ